MTAGRPGRDGPAPRWPAAPPGDPPVPEPGRWAAGTPGHDRMPAVVLSVVLTVLVLAAVVVLVVASGDGDDPPVAAWRPGRQTFSPYRPVGPSPDPVPRASRAARAGAGDCVRNLGTPDRPALRLAACGPGTYQVLRRFEHTGDAGRCDRVAGTDTTYVARRPSAPDFVLCLQYQR